MTTKQRQYFLARGQHNVRGHSLISRLISMSRLLTALRLISRLISMSRLLTALRLISRLISMSRLLTDVANLASYTEPRTAPRIWMLCISLDATRSSAIVGKPPAITDGSLQTVSNRKTAFLSQFNSVIPTL